MPPAVDVPGTLTLTPVVAADAADGDVTGFVTLTHGTDVRRIPFWFRATRPALVSAPSSPLTKAGCMQAIHVAGRRSSLPTGTPR